MSIQFNHTIIPAYDNQLSANFLAEILGLPAPVSFGPFMVVKTNNDVGLDFRTQLKLSSPGIMLFSLANQSLMQYLREFATINYSTGLITIERVQEKSTIMMVAVGFISWIQTAIFLK